MLFLFHLCVVSINLYALWYDQQYVDVPLQKGFAEMPFKGRVIFLTIWGLVLQTLYFTIALLNDLIGTNELVVRKPPLIRVIKDTLFSVSFALATYGTISFWSVCFVDESQFVPDFAKEALPNWVNHVMHTTIAVFIVIELLVSNKIYPSRKLGAFLVAAFLVTYITWMHYLHATVGSWPYPIFENFGAVFRFSFAGAGVLTALTMYIVGEKANSVLCASPSSKKRKSDKATR